jgi:hypothetical protein
MEKRTKDDLRKRHANTKRNTSFDRKSCCLFMVKLITCSTQKGRERENDRLIELKIVKCERNQNRMNGKTGDCTVAKKHAKSFDSHSDLIHDAVTLQLESNGELGPLLKYPSPTTLKRPHLHRCWVTRPSLPLDTP